MANNYRPQILQTGKDILRQEAQAIESFANTLGDSFFRAVSLIHECAGRIVFSGIGKSGIIAKKIVGTFNSIGKKSFFLHPVEALHGDLGLLDQNDLLIILTKSGETKELAELLNYVVKKGISILSITGSADSSLSKLCEESIVYHIEREACPLAIAPTTSTTLTLAIGDAIAACLINLSKLRVEEFAAYHPSGSIGWKYYLKVKDIMHQGEENPQLNQDASIKEIVQEITVKRMGAVNIVDKGRCLLGIITDGDLRRAFSDQESFFTLSAKDIMTCDPIAINENDLAIQAVHLLENRPSQLPVLPVLNNQGVNTGIIRIHDLVKAGL